MTWSYLVEGGHCPMLGKFFVVVANISFFFSKVILPKLPRIFSSSFDFSLLSKMLKKSLTICNYAVNV